MAPEAVALVGAFNTPLRRAILDQSYEELIFTAAQGALADAQLTIGDVDSVVLGTTDQVHGRIIESMVTSGPAGGVGKDVTTLASAGEHAFTYACMRIQAGQAQRVLVVVASKQSEGLDPSFADLLTAEPFLLRPLGMTSTAAAGLQASAYLQRYPTSWAAVERLRVARTRDSERAYGAKTLSGLARPDNPEYAAWPLTQADLPVPCDAACAAVLVAGDAVTDAHAPAWVRGIGWVEDRYELGDRDLTRFESLERAASMALGPSITAQEIDVVEFQEISTIASFGELEALGLAERGHGSDARLSPCVNPSGGSLPASPGNAAGVLRFLAAAQQVRRRAGAVQVDPPPRTSLGAAMHGFAGQGAAVVVFASSRDAA